MKTWAAFIGGCILGFLSAVIIDLVAPELLEPYTRQFIPATQIESVSGRVVKKERESNRLLMTLSTPKGVLLATFTQKIEEIDLLVAEGYTTTIRLRTYSPFVENPVLERVEASTADQGSESRPSAPQ
ncbi:MAG: hypothetical protein OEU68_05850 [Nitrospira sp.]|jgi:hypothetical protein|nr:hypothetical protein [Nitrospira sp.]MDH4242479.1 hypothetical protein [Nitrospira sp.]MDH4355324.1 hypothetical protein [Nitrospira sp.]MDH5317442.1 hypothetical protein [Nitrospira sp.]